MLHQHWKNYILRSKHDESDKLPGNIVKVGDTCKKYSIGKIYISAILPSTRTDYNLFDINKKLKFSQYNPQSNFLNFLTSKNSFITLQYFGDILGIFLEQTFVECSSNILEPLLRNYWNFPKYQHWLLSNHTL